MKNGRTLRFLICFLVLGVLAIVVYGGQDLVKSLAGTQDVSSSQTGVSLATKNGATTTTDQSIISSTTASSSNIVTATETIPAIASTPTSVLTSVVSTPTSTATLTSSTSENLPYSIGLLTGNGFGGNDGWIKWWGNFLQTNGLLTIGADASSTGGGAIFTESGGWSNYMFQANIDWIKGESFGLVARYEGDKNYVICDFGEVATGSVYMNLRQFVNGNETDLAQGYIPNYNGIGGTNIPVAIEVQGEQATCGFNGHAISAAIASTASTFTQTGDIGFSTWDPALNNSEIIVHNVDVETGVYNLQTYVAPPVASSSIPAPTQVAALALPYNETNFAGDANWDADWGASTIDPSSNALIVESASTTTGANVILDNSMPWTNYQFDTTVDWIKGESFSLIARYIDGNDYVACQFYQPDSGDLQIHLEQFVNGQENDLVDGYISDYLPSPNSLSDASIKVYGTEGTCSFDNYQVSNQGPNSYLLNAPFVGGIGYATWDPAMDNTEVIVKSVNVEQAAN